MHQRCSTEVQKKPVLRLLGGERRLRAFSTEQIHSPGVEKKLRAYEAPGWVTRSPSQKHEFNAFEEDEAEEAAAAVAESSRKALGEVLGRERRDRILGALYIVRQDAVSAVRQASIQIWKAIVHNTPRTGQFGIMNLHELLSP